MANPKEPFIPQSDRPDVKLDPDKSVGELTVRDLQSIVAGSLVYKYWEKSWDKTWDKPSDKYFTKDIKEYAYEKDPRIETYLAASPADPGASGVAQLIAHVGGLHKKIDELSNQIAELKKSK
jgi:hypothetical protein